MRNEGAVQPRRSRAVRHEGGAASGNGSHISTASDADVAAARRVAGVKRRGTQLITLDASVQLQREQRLRGGADWEQATRHAAKVTRIRVEEEESPSAEAASGRRMNEHTERRAQIDEIAERAPLQPSPTLPAALDVVGFGSPWSAPGLPVICRMGCERAAFDQSRHGGGSAAWNA